MKKQTVNSQIDELAVAVANGDGSVEDLIVELDTRRKTAAQKEAIAALIEMWENGDEEGISTNMSKRLQHYRQNYVQSIAASGSKSVNNGDIVATYLEYMDAEEVMELADEFCPLADQTHAERYETLNEGSKRMNAGNKLRAAVKRGELEVVCDDDGVPSHLNRVEAE